MATVVGLPSDREKVERLRNKASFIDLVGRTSLRELMGVIAGSKAVVSNDSSPVHIANALGVPAFTVYTSTSPEYGFYPLKGGYIKNPAPCSPCSPNPKRCKTGSGECLSLPSPDSVLESLKDIL
jgi:heptosyltransferase-2